MEPGGFSNPVACQGSISPEIGGWQPHHGGYFGTFSGRFACESGIRCDPNAVSGRAFHVSFRQEPVEDSTRPPVSER
jgi:hypothetical protein